MNGTDKTARWVKVRAGWYVLRMGECMAEVIRTSEGWFGSASNRRTLAQCGIGVTPPLKTAAAAKRAAHRMLLSATA